MAKKAVRRGSSRSASSSKKPTSKGAASRMKFRNAYSSISQVGGGKTEVGGAPKPPKGG